MQAKVIAAEGQWPEEGIQACPCISDPDSHSWGPGSRQSGNQPSTGAEGWVQTCSSYVEYGDGNQVASLQGKMVVSVALQPVGGWKEP